MTPEPTRRDDTVEVLRGAPTPTELVAVSRAVAAGSRGGRPPASALDRWRADRRAALRAVPLRSAGG